MNPTRHSLEFDHTNRRYALLAPDEPTTLLLFLHGSQQSANVARSFTGNVFDGLTDHGFAVCYPDGVGHHFNDARRGLTEATRRQRIDDVGFLSHLIAALNDDYSFDTVIGAGYSNGGQMVTRLLHDAPGLLNGAVTFAAPVPAPNNMLSRPEGWVPTPIIQVHGTADPMVPFDGGQAGFEGASRGAVLSAADSAAYYADLNGCGSPTTEKWHADTTVTHYPGAHNGAPSGASDAQAPASVELITVDGMGHVVPSPRELDERVGPGTDSFTGAEVVLRLLAQL